MIFPRSVYIHVPFCAHRCGYCDFTLVAGRDDLIERYLDALRLEIERAIEQFEKTLPTAASRPLDTVFFGGGTPTHLSEPQLARLIALVHEFFELSPDTEFSIEANPAGLSVQKLDLLRAVGVNRISLGVQSFDDALLATLERDHRQAGLRDCLDRVRERFSNWSLDLIFSVPGQTLAGWRDALAQALQFEPAHLSTYGLTFEKGTAFWTRREKGRLDQTEDGLDRDMYSAAMDDLSTAGFEQYEISSFARPGFRCRHNQVYWTGLEWWGFGPGAAALRNGCRSLNHRSTTTWLKRVLAGEDPIAERETLNPEEQARERLVLGLRRIEGVNLEHLATLTQTDITALTASTVSRLQCCGWLELAGPQLRLTREGRFFYDSVAGELLVD